ncbi:hypothetical protein LEP1GSC059_0678 [Leptospira noguchii serovar Panama str. CZ214]|uniref:Uncharacterized protein n=1 Tax=Leptospira noguchii serovar Panama str. CZ214 TaxID=1001595 RepID=T0FJN1_9LEPT|nr:hypothetical protein LEP1GSC059_0678 [Leptospira noguchii serovar Panama str. CZ214]
MVIDVASVEFKSSFMTSDLVCLKEERSSVKKSSFKNKDVSLFARAF